jgi:predicted PurR-regulated permease PerM
MQSALKKQPLIEEPDSVPKPSMPERSSGVLLWIGVALVVYLCWLLVAPFLPALAFAFALAMLAEPIFAWLVRRLKSENSAALITVVMVCLTLVLPVIFLAQLLVREAMQGMSAISGQDLISLRATVEHNAVVGPVLRWLDSRVDWPTEAAQIGHTMFQRLSALMSPIISGSAWAITQLVTMVVVLFYFLRDQASILASLRSLVPLNEEETGRSFARITETIRISLYGKVVVAAIQGGLGGLIFWWLGLPAPVFWGFVMALLSVLRVLGAFVIWVPAAVGLALAGEWGRALLLTAWGFLIVHPVDNFLGPVIVGTKLRLHTLLIFFSVIGGLAAFGASGIVLGPVVVAIGVSLFEIRQRRRQDAI